MFIEKYLGKNKYFSSWKFSGNYLPQGLQLIASYHKFHKFAYFVSFLVQLAWVNWLQTLTIVLLLRASSSGEKCTEEQAPKILTVICLTTKYCKVAQDLWPKVCIFKKNYAPKRHKKAFYFGRKLFKNEYKYQGYLGGLLG